MRTFLLAPLLLFIWTATAFASSTVQNLYEVKVDVDDESPQTRDLALQKGLKQVLVRVSGNLTVDKNSGIAQALQAPTPYVLTYRYLRGSDGGQPSIKLLVSFNRSQVVNLLNQNGIQVWGSRRPTTVVWMALDDGRNRTIVSSSSNLPPKTELQKAASARGIPLVFPTMDSQDRQAVRFTDIWGGFDDAIRSASKRYNADAQLVGRIYRAGSNWTARWSLTIKSKRYSWQSSSPDIAQVMAAGVNGATDKIAQVVESTDTAIPVVNNDSSSVRVSVANVTGLPAFIAVQQQFAALKKQGVVKTAKLVEITSDRVVYAVESRSGSENSGVRQAMTYAKKIRQDSSSAGVNDPVFSKSSSSTVLRYRYNP